MSTVCDSGIKRSDLALSNIDYVLSTIYNKVMHNTNTYYDNDSITKVMEDVLLYYLEIDKCNRDCISRQLVEKYLLLFTKILTICSIEATGYLVEMNIPQLIIGIYKNRDNIPQLPYMYGYTVPKLEDIIPDSEAYLNEFIRCFTIMYKEYFYSDDPELEKFKIPLFMTHHVDFVDKTIYTSILNWFHRYLKGRNRILNNTDMYLIDCIVTFIRAYILGGYELNMTKTYIEFMNDIGTEMMPYYYEVSQDSFWILDQALRAVYDELAIHLETLLIGFYYNPLVIRLIIGTKMLMFTTYAKKVGKYYYESII